MDNGWHSVLDNESRFVGSGDDSVEFGAVLEIGFVGSSDCHFHLWFFCAEVFRSGCFDFGVA